MKYEEIKIEYVNSINDIIEKALDGGAKILGQSRAFVYSTRTFITSIPLII